MNWDRQSAEKKNKKSQKTMSEFVKTAKLWNPQTHEGENFFKKHAILYSSNNNLWNRKKKKKIYKDGEKERKKRRRKKTKSFRKLKLQNKRWSENTIEVNTCNKERKLLKREPFLTPSSPRKYHPPLYLKFFLIYAKKRR